MDGSVATFTHRLDTTRCGTMTDTRSNDIYIGQCSGIRFSFV